MERLGPALQLRSKCARRPSEAKDVFIHGFSIHAGGLCYVSGFVDQMTRRMDFRRRQTFTGLGRMPVPLQLGHG